MNIRENAVAPDWQALRHQFPTLEHCTYVNAAQKAPLARWAEEAIAEWVRDVYENAGENAFSMDRVEETRAALARLLGVPAATLALIKNTSEGVNIIAHGLALEPGDNVLVSEAEHENNTFPWRYLASRGVEVRFVKPEGDGRIPVPAYEKMIDRRTRVVAAAWVTYGLGYRTDLPALSKLCRAHDALLIVDGVQALGVLATSLSDLGADAVISGGHKGLYSLAGAGCMYVREDLIGKITPPYAAKYSFASNDRMRPKLELAPDAHRFEYGNPNFLGIWVQRRSAEMLMDIGLHNIEARIRDLTTYAMDNADKRGIRVRTPADWRERAGIVSFDTGAESKAMVARLKHNHIIVSEKDGHVRASVGFFNNEADIDAMLDVMKG
ncbi:MAG: aminotransferase class V-fold PLP-dependent enzyme [Burkholderiales bacterium]